MDQDLTGRRGEARDLPKPRGWLPILPWAAGLVLVASVGLALWAYGRDRAIDAAVRRDNALVVATERLLFALKDVETGQRGDEYLGPYDTGRDAVASDLARVGSMVGDSAAPLKGLADEHLREADDSIDA